MTLEAPVTTPRVRSVVRRWSFWGWIAIIVVGAAIVGALVQGARPPGEPLSPTNPAPSGAQAVAEVLRERGVDVVVAEELASAIEAVGAGEDVTLLVHDPLALLDEEAHRALDGAASRLVLLEPGVAALLDLADGVTQSGFTEGSEPARADCAVPEAERAVEISSASTLYTAPGAVAECWREPSGARMIVLDGERGEIVVLGAAELLANERITRAGNAAFALGLLGRNDTLVWYRPSIADLAGGAPPATLGELSPDWVVPFALLAVVVVACAAVWRGRRLGPLVVEPLPSVVPADETMRGRARLYARARARLRAADALRIGTIGRVAERLGLASSASLEEIILASSAATRRPAAQLRELLVDAEPRDDRALVRLSDELLALEREIARATRPPGQTGE